MIRRNHTRRWGGRAIIVATLLAVCAALIPSQASAALPKKVSDGNQNAYTAASCSFTKVSTDVLAGTTTYKVTGNARPRGFNAFKNVQTDLYCGFIGPFGGVSGVVHWTGKTTVNKTTTLTALTADIGCLGAQSETIQKNGAYDDSFNCIPVP